MDANTPIRAGSLEPPLKPNSVERVRSDSGQSTVQRSDRHVNTVQRKTAEMNNEFPAAEVSGETALPFAILNNPTFVRAEWAWRRLILSNLEEASQSEAAADQPANRQDVVETLWKYLVTMADETNPAQWETTYSGTPPAEFLIPFSQILNIDPSRTLPEHVKKWVLRDRLVSAARAENAPMVGEGMFVQTLTQFINQPSARLKAHRWRAERDTRETSQGRIVHRLHLELRVQDAPVHVQILCCKPALSVHIATDSKVLRNVFETQLDHLKQAIGSSGWSVASLSLGHLEATEEVIQ